MDDITAFADDPGTLAAIRDTMAAWLHEERGLALKHPAVVPRRTDRWHTYLGYRVSQRGLEPGPRMKARVQPNLAGRLAHPDRVRASVAGMAATWTFG